MKKTLILLLAAFLCVTLLACGETDDPASGSDLDTNETLPASGTDLDPDETEAEKTPLSVESLASVIAEQATYKEDLIDMKESRIGETFGIDQTAIAEASCRVSGSGGYPDMCLVVRTNTEEEAAAMRDKLDEYLERESERWSTYKPEQQPKLDSAVLDVNGCYVVLSVSENNSEIGITVYASLRY